MSGRGARGLNSDGGISSQEDNESGHGCFGVYLATRGHGEHTRPVHEQDKRELAAQVDLRLSKDYIIATMLKSPDSWDRIGSFIRRAIKTKGEKEREMRRKDS